jgi:hypothetical protein
MTDEPVAPLVTYSRRGRVGSGAYQVTHTPCGQIVGAIAARGDGRGHTWLRVAIPPMSWRSPDCPRRPSEIAAVAVLLDAHTCPEETPCPSPT